MKNLASFVFINKSLFFPEKGILVIGDLHIGYEDMLIKSGLSLPKVQVKDMLEDLRKILLEIKINQWKIKKMIFLGDIKHYFRYDYQEKRDFLRVWDFVKENVEEKNLVFIKGNHDKVDFSYGKMREFYLIDDLAFIHGDILIKKILNRKIKTIIMGHIHPSVMLKDKHSKRREKYKCFLIGKWKGKQIIILPSFFKIMEGTTINEYKDDEKYGNGFSIIPKNSLLNFKVFIIEDKSSRIYEFGKIKNLVDKSE